MRPRFSINGVPAAPFDSEMVRRGKAGCRRSPEEAKMGVEKASAVEKYPISFPMLLE